MNGFYPEGWSISCTEGKKKYTAAALNEAQAKQTVMDS